MSETTVRSDLCDHGECERLRAREECKLRFTLGDLPTTTDTKSVLSDARHTVTEASIARALGVVRDDQI